MRNSRSRWLRLLVNWNWKLNGVGTESLRFFLFVGWPTPSPLAWRILLLVRQSWLKQSSWRIYSFRWRNSKQRSSAEICSSVMSLLRMSSLQRQEKPSISKWVCTFRLKQRFYRSQKESELAEPLLVILQRDGTIDGNNRLFPNIGGPYVCKRTAPFLRRFLKLKLERKLVRHFWLNVSPIFYWPDGTFLFFWKYFQCLCVPII